MQSNSIVALWNWLNCANHAAAVQAIASVAGVIGLGLYVLDTRRMRKTSEAQHTASFRPVVGLRSGHHPTDKTDTRLRWFFVNVGPGAAFNIRCVWITQLTFAHIEPSGYQNLTTDFASFEVLLKKEGLAVAYEDIFGNVYASEFNPGVTAFDSIGIRPKRIGKDMSVEDIWTAIGKLNQARR